MVRVEPERAPTSGDQREGISWQLRSLKGLFVVAEIGQETAGPSLSLDIFVTNILVRQSPFRCLASLALALAFIVKYLRTKPSHRPMRRQLLTFAVFPRR